MSDTKLQPAPPPLQTFQENLRRILSVPKEEVDLRMDEEKNERAAKKGHTKRKTRNVPNVRG